MTTRQLSAAALAADSDEAREVWERVRAGTLTVHTLWRRKKSAPIVGCIESRTGFVITYADNTCLIASGKYVLHIFEVDQPPHALSARSQLSALQQDVRVMRKALRFYADEATYRASNGVSSAFEGRGTSAIEEDSGKRAREALGDEVTK